MTVAARILQATLVIFLLQLTVRYAVENFATGQIVYTAPRLMEGRIISPNLLGNLIETKAMRTAASSCRSYLLRPALILQIANLDLQDPVRNYGAWEKAAQHAQDFSRHAVQCAPSDSNFWLRYAMVSRLIAEDPIPLGNALSVAAQYAPFEFAELSFRVLVWRKVSEQTLRLALPALRQDLETIAFYGNDFQLKNVFSSNSDILHQEMRATEKLVETNRAARIRLFDEKYTPKKTANPT